MEKEVYACEVCKGFNVQHSMWVRLNTNEVQDEAGTWNYDGNTWCEDCGEHHKIEIWTTWDGLGKADRQAVVAFQMLTSDDDKPQEYGWQVERDDNVSRVRKGPQVCTEEDVAMV